MSKISAVRRPVPSAKGAFGDVSLRAKVSLVILASFYVLFNLDKQIFPMVANMLAEALAFTDTELGLLQGFVFSIPYAVGVIVVGWLADRFSRRGILFTGVVFWSLAAASSGLAVSFATMAMSRAGVGLGEAALLPAALPLIAAIFPRDKVAGAIGFFYAGSNLGGMFANLVGGVLIDTFIAVGDLKVPVLGSLAPWQSVFLVTGLPGVALAFLAWGVVKPKSESAKLSAPAAAETGPQMSLPQYMRDHWFFVVTFMLATSTVSVCAYTILSWSAPYFGRAFDWSNSVIGLVLAMGAGACVIGNPLWGWVADRLRAGGHIDGVYRVLILAVLAGIPLTAVAFLVKLPVVAIPAFMMASMTLVSFGYSMSALQLAAPANLRGRLTAMKLVVLAIIGLGAGPVSAGFFADHVFHSRDMLGPSIVSSVTLAGLIGAGLLIWGRPAYIRAVRAQEPT